MRKNKGITLISLIVTIIVMLILATVTVNYIVGQNGIISRSQIARNEHQDSVQKEQNGLDNLYHEQENYIVGTTSRGDINSETIKALQEQINQLTTKVEQLEATKKAEVETIFTGKADQVNVEYKLTNSVEQYRFIVVYAGHANNGNSHTSSIFIEVQNILEGKTHYVLSDYYNSSYNYGIEFYINNNKFSMNGITGVTYPPNIYKVIGIK